MRNKLLLAAAIAVLLTLMLPLAPADADVAAPGYGIEGHVAEGGGSGKIPMGEVKVSIVDQQGTVVEGDTDSNGFFSLVVTSNAGLSISFTAFGYTISTCPNTTVQPGTDFLTLNLSTALYNSATRTYTITSSVDDMQPAFMANTEGFVRGTVSSEGDSVSKVTVTLVPVDGEGVYSAHTGDKGFYEIKCPTGRYVLTASGEGFNTSSGIPVNITSSPSRVDVSIEKSELKKYLGLDAAHILMLMAVIVGILLAAAAWLLSERMNGPNRLEIFDDSEDEYDEDIRYP